MRHQLKHFNLNLYQVVDLLKKEELSFTPAPVTALECTNYLQQLLAHEPADNFHFQIQRQGEKITCSVIKGARELSCLRALFITNPVFVGDIPSTALIDSIALLRLQRQMKDSVSVVLSDSMAQAIQQYLFQVIEKY